MTDKVKKINVITKSRMLLGGKLVDAGTAAEVTEKVYESHKSHFTTQAQAQKGKKAKELEGELAEVKAALSKANETNEALKAELDSCNEKLAKAGDK